MCMEICPRDMDSPQGARACFPRLPWQRWAMKSFPTRRGEWWGGESGRGCNWASRTPEWSQASVLKVPSPEPSVPRPLAPAKWAKIASSSSSALDHLLQLPLLQIRCLQSWKALVSTIPQEEGQILQGPSEERWRPLRAATIISSTCRRWGAQQ